MADKENKWSENVEGSFYVDDQCIACDACILDAPKFFEMNSEDGHAYVKLQPSLKSDIEECNQALDGCPVGAIGKDG